MEKEIEIAAEWWTNILRERNPRHDNEMGPGTHWLNDDIPGLDFLPEYWLKQYKEELIRLITDNFNNKRYYKEMDGTGFCRNGDCRYLTVDYDARGALYSAYKNVFENKQEDWEYQMDRRYPIKSDMYIDEGIVKVRQGYTGKWIKLYESEHEKMLQEKFDEYYSN